MRQEWEVDLNSPRGPGLVHPLGHHQIAPHPSAELCTALLCPLGPTGYTSRQHPRGCHDVSENILEGQPSPQNHPGACDMLMRQVCFQGVRRRLEGPYHPPQGKTRTVSKLLRQMLHPPPGHCPHDHCSQGGTALHKHWQPEKTHSIFLRDRCSHLK